jgi:hypothetical protein
MNIGVRDALLFSGFQEGKKVIYMGVNPTVRYLPERDLAAPLRCERETYQAKEVEPTGSFHSALAAIQDLRILVECPFFDGNVNADNILPYDAACADVQMSKKNDMLCSKNDKTADKKPTRPRNCPSNPHSNPQLFHEL